MKNLTTPQAILCGFALVALAIASIPYSSNIVSPAQASGIQKVAICDAKKPNRCAKIYRRFKDARFTYLSAGLPEGWVD